MNDVIVTSEHLRTVPGLTAKPGYCVRSSRAWFIRHGLDFRGFLRDGIPGRQLEATGDALALRLVQHARAMEARRGR